MQKLKSVLTLAAAVTLCTAACAGAETVYRELYAQEVTTMNYLRTATVVEFTPAMNFVDSLVLTNQYGQLVPALATEWKVSPDGLKWTFKLRKDAKWYTCDGKKYAPVVAQDFVEGLRWVVTAANNSKTADIVSSVIKNAQGYLSGKVTDFSQVGIRAIDDFTLEYTLKAPTPYFLSMLGYVCFMPVNGKFLRECGAKFGSSAATLLYCGAYICKEFNPQENAVWVKNPHYRNAKEVFIDRIERTYNAEAMKIAPEMYRQGTVDQATIPAELIDEWMKNPETKDLIRPTRLSSHSYWWLFNFKPMFDKAMEPDNWKIAVNNENFRKSIAFAIDRSQAEYPYEPRNTKGNLLRTITPPGFASANGKDYTQMGSLAKFSNTDPFDPKAALAFKEKAIPELKAAGAKLPVKILMPYNPSTPYWGESCQMLQQQLEKLLGRDYINVIVQAGPSTNFLAQVRRSGHYALMLCNWGPDYADPETYTDPWSLGYTYNYPELTTQKDLLTGRMYTEKDMEDGVFDNKKFIGTPETHYIAITEKAKNERLDVPRRYALFAESEAYLLEHAIVIPFHRQTSDGYVVSKLSVFDGHSTAYGTASPRFEGLHVLDKPISAKEYYKQLQEWQDGRAKAIAAAAKK